MSNQRLIQRYLERHDIGKLFENMMAKLIKEMPNEPISYLIRLLKRVSTGSDCSGATSTSSILYKPDIGLKGTSIPEKYPKDPQITLSGSKPVASLWMESPDTEEPSLIANEHDIQSRRGKPRSVGSKLSKGNNANKDFTNSEPVSWKTGRLSSKSMDDMFNQNSGEHVKNTLRRSHPRTTPKEIQRNSKNIKDGNWSDPTIEEKESGISLSNSIDNYPIIRIERLDNPINDEDDYELHVSSRENYDNKKKTCSSTRYSKYKRKSAKKKSLEHKQKLQALLSVDQNKHSKGGNPGDSTDYDGDEIFEDANELLIEGAKLKNGHNNHIAHKPQVENVKVFICSTCAKVIGNKNQRIRSDNNGSSVSDDDEFVSVSQLDQEKPYKPVWHSVLNSETEDVINGIETIKTKDSLQKGVSLNTYSRSGDDEKSDFFKINNPFKKKIKQFSCCASDNDTEVNDKTSKMSKNQKKGWSQRIADSDSEADADEENDMQGFR